MNHENEETKSGPPKPKRRVKRRQQASEENDSESHQLVSDASNKPAAQAPKPPKPQKPPRPKRNSHVLAVAEGKQQGEDDEDMADAGDAVMPSLLAKEEVKSDFSVATLSAYVSHVQSMLTPRDGATKPAIDAPTTEEPMDVPDDGQSSKASSARKFLIPPWSFHVSC